MGTWSQHWYSNDMDQTSGEPLTKTMMTQVTDTYICNQVFNLLRNSCWLVSKSEENIIWLTFRSLSMVAVFYLTTRPAIRDGKIILQMGENFYNHIEIVNVTCPNILKMGVWMGTRKSLGRTLGCLVIQWSKPQLVWMALATWAHFY